MEWDIELIQPCLLFKRLPEFLQDVPVDELGFSDF